MKQSGPLQSMSLKAVQHFWSMSLHDKAYLQEHSTEVQGQRWVL